MDFWQIIESIKKRKIFLTIFLIGLIVLVLYFEPLFSNQPLGLDSISHLSKASYIQQHGMVSWDMSWYSGTPFLKFYSPLFYFILFFFPNLILSSLFLCVLSIFLSSVGIFFLVKHYTKNVGSSLVAALFFLSVINLSYYFISVGNYPYIFALWTIPFTSLFLEKTLENKKYLPLYFLFFLIGVFSHIFIGFILLFLVFVRIFTYVRLDIKKILRLSFILLFLPMLLISFWFFPFLSGSSRFVGDEIFIPKISSLFGFDKTITWGIGVDSIGLAFAFFIFLLFFTKKDFKDKNYLYILVSSIILFFLLMGVLGPYYPKGIGSIRFITPFSILLCVFIGLSLAKNQNFKKAFFIIFLLLFISLAMNYFVIKSNYKDYSYSSDDPKYGQFGTIHKDFYLKDFPPTNNFSNYRFGSARFPFSRDLTFVFPFISQTGGYYDQGILYEDTFYKMKNSIWDSDDMNKTLYYLDWYGIKFFEVSGGYLLEHGKKFEMEDFKLVFERTNNTYPYKIYEYKNASPIISVIRTNFISFNELNDSFLDSLAINNKDTRFIVPFISKSQIKIFNNYSILNYSFERKSPDFIEVFFDEFSGEEGILFKESYDVSWRAKEIPSNKSLEVYKTANNLMLILPNKGAERVIIYQSKSTLDYLATLTSILSIILLFIIVFSKLNLTKTEGLT